jgi:hypothetical protein
MIELVMPAMCRDSPRYLYLLTFIAPAIAASGLYAHSGSSPFIAGSANARACDPPQIQRNSHMPHLPVLIGVEFW